MLSRRAGAVEVLERLEVRRDGPGVPSPDGAGERLAAVADVTGWGFDALEGRATEERPPWGYAHLLARAVAEAQVAVDLDTGGGEVLAECPVFAAQQHATES